MGKMDDIIDSYRESNPQPVIFTYYQKPFEGLLYHTKGSQWEAYVFVPTETHIFPENAGSPDFREDWCEKRPLVKTHIRKLYEKKALLLWRYNIYEKHRKGLLKPQSFTDIWEMKREKELHRDS